MEIDNTVNNDYFEQILNDFKKSDSQRKIEIYATTEGLNQQQYAELLRHFPLEELDKLEAALG